MTLVIPIGINGSGYESYSEDYGQWISESILGQKWFKVSANEIRKERFGSVNNYAHEDEVMKMMVSKVHAIQRSLHDNKLSVKNDKDFIYFEAPNLRRSDRLHLINLAKCEKMDVKFIMFHKSLYLYQCNKTLRSKVESDSENSANTLPKILSKHHDMYANLLSKILKSGLDCNRYFRSELDIPEDIHSEVSIFDVKGEYTVA